MADPFLVPITSLRRTPGARRHEHRRGPLGELQVAGTVLAANDEVDIDVVLDVVDGGIEVSGEVRAPWRGECRRCLRPVAGALEAGVRELYRPRPAGDAGDDEETYPLSGELLDLRPLARDAVLLDLPLAPLCRLECAGLCPTCGRDRNDGECGCPGQVSGGPWAALDALRVRPSGGDDAHAGPTP